jgi:hypothetical protein
LSLGEPCRRSRSIGLDHGNALAIDRRHQNRAGGRRRDAFLIEDVKVSGRIQQQFFQAALGNRQAGEVGDAINRFLESALHRRLDQPSLQLVREHTAGKASAASKG